ncbi:MAG: phosphatidylcholine/phosphatidylserine synthase [Hyphomicrobiaceae bacterium]|nr:phosphatidylcholine/phosphatidylserine synthase [Hyphomicrobiaceae bacterium]
MPIEDEPSAPPARVRRFGRFGRFARRTSADAPDLPHRRIPVRYLVPNFFTLLSLCAGVTAIRAAIEGRFELAVALLVVAALLDAVDGRLARALKAQSRFGAELDSLADFVSFGVAPAIVLFTWGLGGLKSLGWIAVLLFACAMSLRLARFNVAIDDSKPRWQSNYFTGVPAPAGAVTVLLPIYLHGAGLDLRQWPEIIALYAFGIAGLLVSTLPTYSGKLAGERIAREYVPPVLAAAAMLVGLLVTYPYVTMTTATLLYLAHIPWCWTRYRKDAREWAAANSAASRDELRPRSAFTANDKPVGTTRIPGPGDTRH